MPSQGLQEVHHRVDLSFGENAVASERRHHGQRIAFGFVGQDGNELVAIRVLGLDVLELRPDRAGQVAALDVVAGQAIALAAVKGDLLALGGSRLGAGRLREGGQDTGGREREGGDQGRRQRAVRDQE